MPGYWRPSIAVPVAAFMAGAAILFMTGCSTSLHGSFIPYTYAGTTERASATELGAVVGHSCQTQPLYVLAMGDPATTDAAINDAKNQISGTTFLADLSIDDETEWKFAYSIQCIVVRATAYK
ncbi:MAG: hypothetical protein KAR22_02650 [Gammaproteobacteria bacterium]|nr:hypothetical protein [Gammaproteobacteria bacterium]